MMVGRRVAHLLGLLLALGLWLGPAGAADQWQWTGVDRVVAVGDVHGAYEEVFGILRQAGVIDAEGHWSGGNTHLVSMGDLVDRGPGSRDVLDLFMRLQQEAPQSGGAVHVVLGNHEAMHMTGELQYTSAAEFAEFASDEDPAQREAEFEHYLQQTNHADTEGARASFDERYPPGYFAHREAFSPEGRYGQWILQLPVVIEVNGTLFVHGGLVDGMTGEDPAAFNARMQSDLRKYATSWRKLLEAGVVDDSTAFDQRASAAAAAAIADPELADAAAGIAESEQSLVFTAEGPLWYRGTALCNPNSESIRVERVLDHFGAERSVHGHTPTPDRVIVERMEDEVFLIDTGMLAEFYKGKPSAFVQTDQGIAAAYAGAPGTSAIGPEPRRVGPRPDHLTDDQIEDILADGKIVSIEDVGEGVTKPQKVVLQKDGHEIKAIFKTESTPVDASSRRQAEKLINLSDRWQHEVAAYRLDRLIHLDLVPVTVERNINGKDGSLSFWIDGLISELERENDTVPAEGWCSLREQWPLMFVFDALVYNEDRTKQNMVYGREDWMMYLIDHSRSFRTHRGRPKDIRKVKLTLSPLLAERLEALNYEQLNVALGGLLEKSQIQAILRRRDEILEDWKKGK